MDSGIPVQRAQEEKVFELIPLDDGMVGDVAVYASEACAQRAEQEWPGDAPVQQRTVRCNPVARPQRPRHWLTPKALNSRTAP